MCHEIVQDQHRLRLLRHLQAVASRHRVRFRSDSHLHVPVVLIVEVELVVDARGRLRVAFRAVAVLLVPRLAYSSVLQRLGSEHRPTRGQVVVWVLVGVARLDRRVVGIAAVRLRVLPLSFVVGIEQHLQRRGLHQRVRVVR